MGVGALLERIFITKEVLCQPFAFAVNIISPYTLSIYKTVLLSLEVKIVSHDYSLSLCWYKKYRSEE